MEVLEWRGEFRSAEFNALHGEAFGHDVCSDRAWDCRAIVERHSLGWVTARDDGLLVGFVNLPWDGLAHAWIQDMCVALGHRHKGIATALVAAARDAASDAGCAWLHVDFEDELAPLYITACGFRPTAAGLIPLR